MDRASDPHRVAQQVAMERYYVLWVNASGLKVWSGPYDTFDEARRSTAMRDRQSGAIVTMTSA